uniref:HTH_Tnp_Tc3_1 domain-containing protein n=1 Tax=Caenorhabditis tropicalis TaxID=1561998 RepID=A0A1I7U1P0_9PELO
MKIVLIVYWKNIGLFWKEMLFHVAKKNCVRLKWKEISRPVNRDESSAAKVQALYRQSTRRRRSRKQCVKPNSRILAKATHI